MQVFHFSNKQGVDPPGPAVGNEIPTAEIDACRVVRYKYRMIPGNNSSVGSG